MKKSYYVDTSLILCGTPSLTKDEVMAYKNDFGSRLVWLEKGKIKTGNLQDAWALRESGKLDRIDGAHFEEAKKKGKTAALTASGAMAAAKEKGVSLVVTSGLGGIGGKNMDMSSDLPSLAAFPGTVIASGFKDSLKVGQTVVWLLRNGVSIQTIGDHIYKGYLFNEKEIAFPNWKKDRDPFDGLLLLVPTPTENHLTKTQWLTKAVKEGNREAIMGRPFQAAVSKALDKLSDGESSRLQLKGLAANCKAAAELL